jgi:hypothetical protein
MSSVPTLFELAYNKNAENLSNENGVENTPHIQSMLKKELNETIHKIVSISENNQKHDNENELEKHLKESVEAIVALSNVDTNDCIFDNLLDDIDISDQKSENNLQYEPMDLVVGLSNVNEAPFSTTVNDAHNVFSNHNTSKMHAYGFDSQLEGEGQIATNMFNHVTEPMHVNGGTSKMCAYGFDSQLEGEGQISTNMFNHVTGVNVMPNHVTESVHVFDSSRGRVFENTEWWSKTPENMTDNVSHILNTSSVIDSSKGRVFENTEWWSSGATTLNQSSISSGNLTPERGSNIPEHASSSAPTMLNEHVSSIISGDLTTNGSNISEEGPIPVRGSNIPKEKHNFMGEDKHIINRKEPQIREHAKGYNKIKNNLYKCDVCGFQFNHATNLKRHQKKFKGGCVTVKAEKKNGQLFFCSYCPKDYTLKRNLLRHIRIKHQAACQTEKGDKADIENITPFMCGKCGDFHRRGEQKCPQKTSILSLLNRKETSEEKCQQKTLLINQRGAGVRKKRKFDHYHCHNCENIFPSKAELYEHYMTHHKQQGVSLQNLPWDGEENAPWYNDGEVDVELQRVYEMHLPIILKQHEMTPTISVYNFPLNNLTVSDLFNQVKYIYKKETRTMKLNMAFGFILKNIETGKVRYFKPYMNQNVLEFPFPISVKKDLDSFYEHLKALDIINYILQQRENTKNKIIMITNVLYTIFPYNDQPLGSEVILPSYIKRNRSILSFLKRQDGVYYNDQLCFFRCLVAHLHPEFQKRDEVTKTEFNKKTKHYFEKWKEFNARNGKEIKKFTGVQINEMSQLELCFQININIFRLTKKEACCSVFRSVASFDSTMYLNQYENHLSYIKDIAVYSKRFICSHCRRIFKRKDHWQNHEKSCENKIKLKYVGGYYSSKQTIFDELENFGISVPHSKRKFKEFAVFDMEAMLSPISIQSTEKLLWSHDHIPISVAICSNIEGFMEPFCIVNDNIDELMGGMMNYLKEIGGELKKRNIEKFEKEFQQLQNKIDGYREESQTKKHHAVMVSLLENVYKKFEKYCFELPVLGFNSGRYDINLIKGRILQALQIHQEKSFIVKKNNNYMCISNGTFKFLDITQFLSPGTSYSSFLKAFHVEMSKGFFPYEYFSCKNKLAETCLPPVEKWWSSLKNKNVLDDGVRSIQDNYSEMQKIWKEENMTTFEDFLKWYNKLDVLPFVTAVERLCKFYFDKEIDLFKETISVPGVSRKMLFNAASQKKALFSLIDYKNKDLYHCINDNIVGGPSIIFTREHQADKTYIRNETSHPCKKIIGFDANALYLWALDQKMPAGGFVRRKRSERFKPEKNDQYFSMFYWMDWVNFTENVNIKHHQNNGKEVRIGPYLVDGYDTKTNTIYQFHGCYFHGHSCINPKNEKEKKLKEKRKERTEMITNYFTEKGFNVVEMYECEFNKMKRKSERLQLFINTHQSPFTQRYPRRVNEKEIIEGVMTEELFGLVEVDISVPDSWEEVSFVPDTKLPPKKYFEEMSPIFGNTEIPYDKIGKVMQDFITDNNMSEKPRRLLVGAMSAEKILLATPLLKWYISHGLKVTKVYQTIEYTNPSHCFSSFVEEVSSSRRKGDLNPNNSTLAETMKLIGNSGFGSMIMNKMRHKNITYVDNYESLSKTINSPKFERLTQISDDFYEIESFKDKIDLDLPTQIGFFILQLAKMRMLQFYYDFMDIYVEREDFQYCEMDTDSAYMGITAERIADIIKPHMKERYEKGLKGFCSDIPVKADDKYHWFPRSCCSEHIKFDKRTPGLFKVEFEGDALIGLCSKTYIVKNENIIKFSSKGVNKSTIKEPMEIFQNVLENRKSGTGSNVGFRLRENVMSTYSQEKNAFSYLYCKRRILDDGISTLPLDITIKPTKKMKTM